MALSVLDRDAAGADGNSALALDANGNTGEGGTRLDRDSTEAHLESAGHLIDFVEGQFADFAHLGIRGHCNLPCVVRWVHPPNHGCNLAQYAEGGCVGHHNFIDSQPHLSNDHCPEWWPCVERATNLALVQFALITLRVNQSTLIGARKRRYLLGSGAHPRLSRSVARLSLANLRERLLRPLLRIVIQSSQQRLAAAV